MGGTYPFIFYNARKILQFAFSTNTVCLNLVQAPLEWGIEGKVSQLVFPTHYLKVERSGGKASYSS